jgi:hypothetical protein
MILTTPRAWLPTLALILLGACAPLWAQMPPTSPMQMMQRQMATLASIREYKALRAAGRVEDAAEKLNSAIVGMDARGEDPILLLPTYAQVLLKLNRADEAIVVLQRVRAAEEAAASNPQRVDSMNAFDAMAAMQATFGFARDQARTLNANLLIVESDEPLPGTAASDPWPEVPLPVVLLADAHSRKGNAAAVHALYDGPFADYLRRRFAATDPDTRFNFDLAAEAACLQFAISLARIGPGPRTEQAFACALDINHARIQYVGATSTVRAFHRGNAAQRRAMLGIYAGHVLADPNADDKARRRVIETIADSKGVATRYMERRNALLATSQHPTLQRLRPRFNELSRSLLDLPTQGSNAVMAQVRWSNEEAALMGQALKPLGEEGLSKVFTRGDALLSRIQAQLGDEVLIGYSIYTPADRDTALAQPARLLRYAVWSDGIDLADVGPRAEVESLVLRWRREPAATGPELSRRLLGTLPVRVTSARRWVIDPDGALNLLPFEALATADGKSVIDGHVLRYVTSMSVLADAPAPPDRVLARAIVVADPQFEAAQGGSGRNENLRELQTAQSVPLSELKLAPLPESRAEATGVAASLMRMGIKSEVLLGEQATLDAFAFKEAPRILHVATHGLYLAAVPKASGNSQNVRVATIVPGLQSALALTPNAEGSLLTGGALARLPLRGTELVVLSACDTGNGSVDVGEGVASLRRAVEEAGARSVVASLWPVPSRATTTLMVDFYARLASGASKSEALREAKLALRRESPDPLQWAGFLLSGAP